MKLVVFSSKVCWADASSPTGYATDGGFPFQMRAISELFEQTRLVLTVSHGLPPGLIALAGHNLEVAPLPTPAGADLRRKLSLLLWLPRQLPRLWREVRRADALHAPVPGDVGVIGLLLALAQKKPLFVRHCGSWKRPITVMDRLLLRLLERVAGGRNVVVATGGARAEPSPNRAVSWIFSTSLTADEIKTLPRAPAWRLGEPPKLVTVSRLTPGKNTAAVVGALALVRRQFPQATLDVVGDGISWSKLRSLASDLGLAEAVTFHGNVAHGRVLEILAGCHVLVFPTRLKEGFPKVVLEAMACGLPVVATAVSVIPRLVSDTCGILLRKTDPESVARAILAILGDQERLLEMSRAAKQRSRAYTLERWRDEIGERLRAGWNLPQGDPARPGLKQDR